MTAAALIQGIIAFLQALPSLLNLFATIGNWLNKISGNDPAAFIVKLGSALDQLNSAQTQEDKQSATQSIADLIHHLPD